MVAIVALLPGGPRAVTAAFDPAGPGASVSGNAVAVVALLRSPCRSRASVVHVACGVLVFGRVAESATARGRVPGLVCVVDDHIARSDSHNPRDRPSNELER